MQIKVSRSNLSGEIRSNRSKSYTQRAYAIAALADSPSVIRLPSWSDDGRAALGIARALGAKLEVTDSAVGITPREFPVANTWNVGESGLGLRMFSPIAALQNFPVNLDGHGTLRSRPLSLITEALTKMGVEVNGSQLPLRITGPIDPGEYAIDGSLSSQLITGLLLSLPLLQENSILHIDQLRSRPYIDMTIDIMRHFGVNVLNNSYTDFEVRGNQSYSGADYTVEADWSGLAFPLVAGVLTGNVVITDVSNSSLQADKAILRVLELCGANIELNDNALRATKSEMKAFVFDAADCPDLFPPLVILAARCEGISRIKGVHRLTHKESNRAEVLKNEFAKLGVQMVIADDELIIAGFQQVNGGEADAQGDHRIAMALTLAGLVAQRDVIINGAESVAKSYPDFYADISLLRGRLSGPEVLFKRIGSESFLEDLPQHHE